jgi:hypothetical protein
MGPRVPMIFSKKTLHRLLAVALVFAVVALVTDATTHWHSSPVEQAHCQACHIGHASAPGPTAPAAIQTPVPVARFAPVEPVSIDLGSFRAPSIPRAPPA